MAKIPQLIEFLKSEVVCQTSSPSLLADCVLNAEDVSLDVLDNISVLEPFGMHNSRPKFVVIGLKPVTSKIVGGRHVSVSFETPNGDIIRAIAFKAAGTSLEDLLLHIDDSVAVLGQLTATSWKGTRYINLQLEDIASVSSPNRSASGFNSGIFNLRFYR